MNEYSSELRKYGNREAKDGGKDGKPAFGFLGLSTVRSGYNFKRLFTISEYYDRNHTAYYRALQTVREQNLDLTGWLEYFTEGLATQLAEVQQKGELLIRQDVLTLKYSLSERQKAVVGLALRQSAFSIKELEALLPGVHRRTLQRELKELLDQGLFVAIGDTRNLACSLAK